LREAGQVCGGLLRDGVEPFCRYEPVDEPELERSAGFDPLAGQHEVARRPGADLVDQLFDSARWDPAERHLGCGEDRPLLSDAVVGVERKKETAAEGTALDLHDDRRSNPSKCVAEHRPAGLVRDDRV
jgi:hypothetical protein